MRFWRLVYLVFKLKHLESVRACPVSNKKNMGKANKKKRKALPQAGSTKKMGHFGILHPHSAAIDIGSMLMMVSYTDRAGMIQLAEFNSFTESLNKLADLLKQEGVKIVGMEATGSYWQALFNILERRGFKIVVINPSHFRNVDAQKTDVNDAQWLHQLLTHGLLRNSHIAEQPYRELRQYLQAREILQDQKGATLNRIQKCLTLMNVKFQNIINDIEGVNSMKLVRAICAGKTDPQQLLSLINHKILKASPEDLLSSFKGDYSEYLVTILSGTMIEYDFYKKQMLFYEEHIEETLKKLCTEEQIDSIPGKKGMVRKNQYHFNLRDYLHAIFGVDLTEVEGLDEISLLSILAVTGTDMRKWPTAAHFASWLNLSPRPKITGGRIVGYEKRFTNNPATQAFRMAANSLWQSKGPLGQQYRQMAARKGTPKTIKAIARKISVIFYNMVLKQEPYDVTRVQQDTALLEAKKLARLERDLIKLGYTIKKAA